ncbi:hypothetical protein T4B_8385 [Trichinella pseudospiralis]|uniref:Uncharacterized protein n=1 Tax=Trichinella pseudospiralis TaxID=6337 RepID=A0A0V1IJ74_TRIPS|nr:hypothetical protein T4B_8385 [Trichinella pseudospiralis]
MELLMSSSSAEPHLALLSNVQNGRITVHRAQSIHNRLATVPLYFCFSKNVAIQDPTITDLKNFKYPPMSSSLTAVMQITRHTSTVDDNGNKHEIYRQM